MEDQTNPCFKRKVLGKGSDTVDGSEILHQLIVYPIMYKVLYIRLSGISEPSTVLLGDCVLVSSCKLLETQKEAPENCSISRYQSLAWNLDCPVDPLEFLTVIHKYR